MVLCDQPVIERHQDGPDLAGPIEALQEEVRVRAQHADPVPGLDAQVEERVGQPVHPSPVLGVAIAPLAIDDGGLLGP